MASAADGGRGGVQRQPEGQELAGPDRREADHDADLTLPDVRVGRRLSPALDEPGFARRGADGASGLTADHIAFWDEALTAATAGAAWHAGMPGNGWAPLYVGSAALRERLARERAEISAVLAELGLLA